MDDVEPTVPFTGVEIGWRLARSSWEHGYATEAARAALTFGFETCDLAEILAITSAANHRSQAVVRRLGMTHDPPDAFDDTAAPEGSIRHVLYRITADHTHRRTFSSEDGGQLARQEITRKKG